MKKYLALSALSLALLASCATGDMGGKAPLNTDTSGLSFAQGGSYENGIRVQDVSLNTQADLNIKNGDKTYPIGYGSAVEFLGLKDGKLLFAGITDRGPNLDGPAVESPEGTLAAKFFPAPAFTPQIVFFSLDPASLKAETLKNLLIKDASGKAISGLPLPRGYVGSTLEVALNLSLEDLGTDLNGLDTEGIRYDARRDSFWISDEYGPFIVEIDATSGKEIRKYAPGKGLPEILAKRQANRGMEGLAIAPNGKIYGLMQSILDVDGNIKASKASFVRLVELDPVTGQVRQFALPIDAAAYKRSKDAKLGELEAIDDTHFLVVEQGADKNGTMRNLLYKIDISQASPLPLDGPAPETLGSLEALKAAGISPASKTLVVDLRARGWNVEKAEGLALIDSKHLLVISDNDFGIVAAISNPSLDSDGKAVEDPTEYVLKDGSLYYKGQASSALIGTGPNPETAACWLISFDQDL